MVRGVDVAIGGARRSVFSVEAALLVRRLRLTVLVEDSASPARRNLTAKHGLSINAEAEAEGRWFSFLIDSGPSADIVLRNVDALDVDLTRVKAIFLSHGHHDHTGGAVGVLRCIKRKTPVIAHPGVFEPKFKVTPALTYIGSPFKRTEVEESGGLLLLSRSPVALMKDVSTTGEVERLTEYEKVTGFWTIARERFVEDILIDDQSLVFKVEGKGLVIVSGCAHSGIVNTVMQSRKVMGAEKIYAVVGGFHLSDATEERIRRTVEDMLQFDPEVLRPCHCTGQKAIQELRRAFGDRCDHFKTGDVIEL